MSITLKGIEGAQKIQEMMTTFRENAPQEVAGVKVFVVEDYLLSERVNLKNDGKETILLLPSNVLKYHLADGSWFCLRPSGTEPKIKFYFGVKGQSLEESQQKIDGLKEYIQDKLAE